MLGPKANNERSFVPFNTMLIHGEAKAKSVNIITVYNGNPVALEQVAEGLGHSSDCCVILVLIGPITVSQIGYDVNTL